MKLAKTLAVILVLLLTAGSAYAQDPVPPPIFGDQAETNITVSFDVYDLDIPGDWLTWRHEDFSSDDDSATALEDLLISVNPLVRFEQAPPVSNLRFSAVKPDLIENEIVFLRVYMQNVSELFAGTELSITDIDPIIAMDTFGYTPIGSGINNGRPFSLGYSRVVANSAQNGQQVQVITYMELTVFYIFPDYDSVALAVFSYPPGYGEDINNIEFMADIFTSLRLTGEAIDDHTWETFVNYSPTNNETAP